MSVSRIREGLVVVDLGALAASGASTVIGLMVTDSWSQVKARIARFLSRQGTGTDSTGGGGEVAEVSAASATVEEELAASQRELTLALEEDDREAVADVEAEWRGRLRRVLRADPAAARLLEELLAELAAETEAGPDAGGSTVHNTVSGGVTVHGAVIQGRDVSGFTVQLPGVPPSQGAGG